MIKLPNADKVDPSFSYTYFASKNPELESQRTLVDYLIEKECLHIRLKSPDAFNESLIEQKAIYFRDENMNIIDAIDLNAKSTQKLYTMMDEQIPNKIELQAEELPILIYLFAPAVNKGVEQWMKSAKSSVIDYRDYNLCPDGIVANFYTELIVHYLLQPLDSVKKRDILSIATEIKEEDIWNENASWIQDEIQSDRDKPKHYSKTNFEIYHKIIASMKQLCTSSEREVIKKRGEELAHKHCSIASDIRENGLDSSDLARFKGFYEPVDAVFSDLSPNKKLPHNKQNSVNRFNQFAGGIICHHINVIYAKTCLTNFL